MRIAVSGTHCTGKSTLIEEFLRLHPEFVHEPEPYAVLVEDFGEEFSANPCADDFLRQLEFQVEMLQQYSKGAKVICERSPIDFLAYVLALRDLGREPVANLFVERLFQLVSNSIRNLDLIIFLPLDGAHGIEDPDEEDLRLRETVDERLSSIFRADEFGIFGAGDALRIIEAQGTPRQQLVALEAAIGSIGFDR